MLSPSALRFLLVLHPVALPVTRLSSPSTPDAPAESRRPVVTFLRNGWDTVKVFLVSLAIIIPFRAYVAQPFFVRGDSMVPNFHDGEYLIVDELSYRFGVRPPQRGDVVVFRYPLDPSQYFIKRIVGLPRESVQIHDGSVVIRSAPFPNGVVLDESRYLGPQESTEGSVDVRLGPNEVFLLGDNRDRSSDSRAWGPLRTDDYLVGRAWVRALPLSRAGFVSNPWYGSLTATAAEALRGTPGGSAPGGGGLVPSSN